MKRDGNKNKYINPRRAEATTEQYLVATQTTKKRKTRDDQPKRLQLSKTPQVKTRAVNIEQCGLTFKTKGIKRHVTVKHKTKTAPNDQ